MVEVAVDGQSDQQPPAPQEVSELLVTSCFLQCEGGVSSSAGGYSTSHFSARDFYLFSPKWIYVMLEMNPAF